MFDLFDGEILFIRMEDGENFYEKLYEALDKYSIESGIILSGIGMLRDFTIGWFNGNEYEKEKISTPHELVSTSGNVSLVDNQIFAHIHAALANPERKLVGGHLFDGIVNNTVELFVKELPDIELYRKQVGNFKTLFGRLLK